MRIAAIYDIHGNLPALEAVLRQARDFAAHNILQPPSEAEALDVFTRME
jgi:hypothetical protein